MDSLLHTYNRLPITVVSGQGAWLTDDKGNRYLDAAVNMAVCALGHQHPALIAAIQDQAQHVLHVGNSLYTQPLIDLSNKLTRCANMDRVFFGNSGAEAVELAIKISRLHGHAKGIDEPKVIVLDGAFHGRTLTTLSASSARRIQAGFEPLVPGFIRAPFDDIDAIAEIAAARQDIAAILLEPIQGSGGVRVPSVSYLSQVRALCDTHGWLMMLDEVQTGMGRTGRYFAFQHHDIKPDVLATAKALGGGIPIGACLTQGISNDYLQPGMHGSTFGGNPFACRLGCTVLDTIAAEDLLPRVTKLGERIMGALRDMATSFDFITQVRGQGLMIGVEMSQNCGELSTICADMGILVNVTAGRVLRLLPPFVLTDDDVTHLLSVLQSAFERFSQHINKSLNKP